MLGEIAQAAQQGLEEIGHGAVDATLGAGLVAVAVREILRWRSDHKDQLSLDEMRKILTAFDQQDQTRDRLAERRLKRVWKELRALRREVRPFTRRHERRSDEEEE